MWTPLPPFPFICHPFCSLVGRKRTSTVTFGVGRTNGKSTDCTSLLLGKSAAAKGIGTRKNSTVQIAFETATLNVLL